LDLTSLTFAISNVGKRKLSYIINTSQDWLTVNPFSGDITSEIDTITVTINKTG
jgi:Holliday junction resolvase-like predicted endonuclease